MLIRILSALAGCAIIIPVLIFSHTWVFPIFMGLVTLVSVYEMLRCIGVHKNHLLSLPIILVSAVTPVVARLDLLKGLDITFVLVAEAVVFVMYVLALSLFSKGKFKLEDAAMVFMTCFYIVGGYTSLVLLRDLSGGKYIYLLVFFGAWFTDIFAYFTGRFFGKHKLIPDISPKKTVEGSVGGVIFCAISYVAYGFVLEKLFSQKPNYIILACVAVVISVVSQIGDLTMSHIKRKYGLKDYGKIMPGHGGLLDRFDCIIAVALMLIIVCGILNRLGLTILEVI